MRTARSTPHTHPHQSAAVRLCLRRETTAGRTLDVGLATNSPQRHILEPSNPLPRQPASKTGTETTTTTTTTSSRLVVALLCCGVLHSCCCCCCRKATRRCIVDAAVPEASQCSGPSSILSLHFCASRLLETPELAHGVCAFSSHCGLQSCHLCHPISFVIGLSRRKQEGAVFWHSFQGAASNFVGLKLMLSRQHASRMLPSDVLLAIRQ